MKSLIVLAIAVASVSAGNKPGPDHRTGSKHIITYKKDDRLKCRMKAGFIGSQRGMGKEMTRTSNVEAAFDVTISGVDRDRVINEYEYSVTQLNADMDYSDSGRITSKGEGIAGNTLHFNGEDITIGEGEEALTLEQDAIVRQIFLTSLTIAVELYNMGEIKEGDVIEAGMAEKRVLNGFLNRKDLFPNVKPRVTKESGGLNYYVESIGEREAIIKLAGKPKYKVQVDLNGMKVKGTLTVDIDYTYKIDRVMHKITGCSANKLILIEMDVMGQQVEMSLSYTNDITCTY